MDLLEKAEKLRAKANDRAVSGPERDSLLAKAEELEAKYWEDHEKPGAFTFTVPPYVAGARTDVYGNPVKPKTEMSEEEKHAYWAEQARQRRWADEDLWDEEGDLEFSVYVNRNGATGRYGRSYSVGDADSLYEERWKYDGQ
jgi:hypothetical protein